MLDILDHEGLWGIDVGKGICWVQEAGVSVRYGVWKLEMFYAECEKVR